MTKHARSIIILAFAALSIGPPAPRAAGKERHLLYVAVPGIRNYVEFGGVGVLVFDMDQGHSFVKRIPTLEVKPGEEPENVKGVCASVATGRIYVTTPKRLFCIDLRTEKLVWDRIIEGGCDRMAISPDGKIIYAPSFEGPNWTVVDAVTGNVLAKIETNSGSHNTVYGPDGREVYLAGLKSPWLFVADPRTHTVARKVGPFSNVIRPLTVNAKQSLIYVNVNDLLGFEIGDLKTGKMLHRVEVTGYSKGPTKRHGCPSHGVGLTPDEREIWVADAANSSVHVFDNTTMPPRQTTSIKLREQPGWITFSMDGRFAYPSTGEVIDPRSKRIITTLADEVGREVHSEKMVEIVFEDEKPVRVGDQFGIGRRR